jgi:phosphoribosylformimino-5-aminoimidazole carboxamide ribotide isomerase
MRVIPVIDLLRGQVVRGVAGKRSQYRPIVSRMAADASPGIVAEAFVERFGFETVYVADLDAIVEGRPDFDSWRKIAACGLTLWVDAGVGNLAAAQAVHEPLRAMEQHRLVVGLESLDSLDELTAICEHLPAPLFSLDLKGSVVQSRCCDIQGLKPLEIAQAAEACGIRDLIVLDLADVGTGGGTRTIELCREIRAACGFRQLIAGGGVRDAADLATLAAAGCDAALVASALHDGRLTRSAMGLSV